MVNYRNGKIYRLVSTSGKQYVGSTTRKLCQRMTGHRSNFKKWKEGRAGFVTAYSLFEEDTIEIFLLENYPCNNSEELCARERHWIETIEGGCVNKIIPTRTYTEYYEQFRERILEYQKEYREQNKEQISERHKEYREQNKQQISERNKEYYEQNKERKIERRKQHYEHNKEQISERNKEKVQCECGAEVCRAILTRHKRTQKHINALNK